MNSGGFLVFAKKLNELEDDVIEHWLLAVAKKKAYEYFRRIKNDAIVASIEDSFTSVDEIFSTMTKFHSYSDADIKMTIEAILKLLTEDEYQIIFEHNGNTYTLSHRDKDLLVEIIGNLKEINNEN